MIVDDSQIGHLAIGQLAAAKQQLGSLLPPQASPILRAFQKLEIALHYAAIEGHARSAWNATSDALRALDRMDKKRELPSPVRVAVANAIADILKALDTIKTETDEQTDWTQILRARDERLSAEKPRIAGEMPDSPHERTLSLHDS